VQGNVSRNEVMLDISELFFLYIMLIHTKRKENTMQIRTSLQERRQEKNMVKWL
jgi:hypothetical protein